MKSQFLSALNASDISLPEFQEFLAQEMEPAAPENQMFESILKESPELKRKLVFMNLEGNNNKYIDVYADEEAGTYHAVTGRIDQSAVTQPSKPLAQMEKYIQSKIKSGYTDVTGVVSNITTKDTQKLSPVVKLLVDALISASQFEVKENYSLSAGQVTQKQIDIAEDLLNSLNALRQDFSDPATANGLIKRLFTNLPRQIKNTRQFYFDRADASKLADLVAKEMDLLDVLKQQVALTVNDNDDEAATSGMNLASYGLDVQEADPNDLDRLAKETDFKWNGRNKIWKVKNLKTEKAFNPKGLKTRLLYHGSKTENYWSILVNGLKIRPQGASHAGSMFGDGIYGADEQRKSIGYTSGGKWSSYTGGSTSRKRYLCVFEFAVGKQWWVIKNKNDRHEGWMSHLDKQQVEAKGYDSVAAKGNGSGGYGRLVMNEYIVYDPNQVTIRYIMEIDQ